MKSLEELLREDFEMYINNKEEWRDLAFVGKDSHIYVPHSIEDNCFVFLEVAPKTDKIVYVSNISDFMFKTVIMIMEEQKEVKIQIPEGYCIDESKSTFEKNCI